MKTIAFVGSNSSKSINKQLTLALLKNHPEVDFIDIQNWNIPLYSEDIQNNEGFPDLINKLAENISEANKIIITVNEHNSNVSAFMKNVLDWLSRHTKKIFSEKDILVLSTSNGQRGGLSANEYTVGFCTRNGAESVQGFTFPSFSENFEPNTQQISNVEKKAEIEALLTNFLK